MYIIRRILGSATFSCKRITELVETKERKKLSFWDGIRYKTHLVVCKACRSYEKQSNVINKALVRLISTPPENLKGLDDSAKIKIWDKIKQHGE